MVRLVFRPYTQVWRTICTSVPLRASIRVSPDFTLLRHSSPSFGSVQHCLYSNLSPKIKVGRLCKNPNCHFHYAYRFATHILAIVDDSLVRVSRRVEKNHFVNVLEVPVTPHRSWESSNLGFLPTVTAIMTQWKHNAFLIRGDGHERNIGDTAAKLHKTPLFPKHSNYVDIKRWETPLAFTSTAQTALAVQPTQFSSASSNLNARNWFHSLPSQRFHALLTLFPKFFSPFPHGTCLLSVSDRYLALEENYLPFCAPFPKNATL